jgi:uncharacterized damage-inducible protein DinB
MTISEMLLPEYDQEMAGARKILACVPQDKLTWKPHEKSMTLGRLASHIAEMGLWTAVTITQDHLNVEPGQAAFNAQTTAELMDAFDRNTPMGRAALAGASDETLQATWTMSLAGKPLVSSPRTNVMRHMVLSHMIHHRGQLSVYLRLLDVAIPGMYGPSADDKSR